ncbi:MAG: MlaD family protein [Thiothrix sp.]
MERDTHYFVVGLFVILTAIAGALFAGLFYNKPYVATKTYAVHFDMPVEGLEEGSEVRYMGIKKGEVTQVSLLADDPSIVNVTLVVEQDTPVNKATVATLRLVGLTGVPFLGLSQADGIRPEPLPEPAKDEIPIIPVKPTPMDALVEKLPGLETELSVLIHDANDVLSAENRQHFAGLLKNLDAASADLPALISGLDETTVKLQTLMRQLGVIASRSEAGLDTNMQELQQTLASIRATSQRLDILFKHVDRLVVNNEGRVNELLGEGGENLKQLLNESRKTAAAIRQLGDKLEQNPSQLIYQPAPQGTELPR